MEGLIYHDDGRIEVRAGDATEVLARPTIGQLRQLTGQARRLADDVTALAERSRDAETGLRAELDDAADAEARIKIKKAIAEESAQFSDELSSLYLEWTVGAIGMLATSARTDWEQVDRDALPAWLASADVPGKMQRHWRTVPSAAGPA